MTATFNASKLAQRFRDKAKFPPEQAEQAAIAVAESFAEWQEEQALATKSDIAEINKTITVLGSDLRHELAEANNKITVSENNLRREMAEMRVDLIKWVVGMSFAQAAMIAGLLKLHF